VKKLLVIGLDCAAPQLVFEAFKADLPNLGRLAEEGVAANLFSTIPPITVPAWTAMMTSKDPGMLGFYGFRNRSSYGYEDLYFANANFVKAKTVWNYLSRNRMASLVFGVPQTYPPKPLNGILISSFLTPNKDVQFTWPDEIKAELDQAAGGNYIIDVEEFRTENKDGLLKQIYEMTAARFSAFKHFYKKQEWPFAMIVEMGIDRIHHGFWRYFDRSHRLYEPGNKYESAIHDYYVYLDKEIGGLLELLDRETSVMVVSDHGAKTMHGAICINEWLQQEGLLALKEKPGEQTRLKMNMIDWKKTRVWGEGGYYCRIFLNVRGREPEGVIPEDEYESFRAELKARLEAIEDEEGRNIGTRVFTPEEAYREVKNIPPDLIVYFGNLDWRSAGSVGIGAVHLYENDTGPDDANHAENGIFIWNLPKDRFIEIKDTFSIYDIAPSILTYLGIEVPADMIGRSLIPRK
jgi:predicted AlkP superfamily phosphohydrolase/phosphomutase